MHVELNPVWFVAPSLDEQIFEALDSTTMVVVRASLQSSTATAEAVSGSTTTYRPVHELRFTVHEYLEGSGPNEIVVVVRGDQTYSTNARATDDANYAAAQRNTSWDNQQAVLFVDLGSTVSGATRAVGSSSARTAEFVRSNPLESAWDYTVDNLSRAWLPAQGSAGGTADSTRNAADPTFITDGAKRPPPTIALANLKSKIASLRTELASGEETAGYKDCVRDRIGRERVIRAGEGGTLQLANTLASGLKAGTEIFRYDEPQRDPEYNRGWLRGPDSELFEAVTIDDDNSPWNGYNLGLDTARPLPSGTYRVHYLFQHHDYIPCNFIPDNSYLDWTVTVTAPTGTIHEAFFDPVAIGSTVGSDASNGVLEPTAFTVGGTSTSLQSIKWQGGSATLALGTPVSLSGHFLDFIALDATVVLSLDGGAATVSGGTQTWSVTSQPWQAGDLLMLRIRQAGAPAPTATPGP